MQQVDPERYLKSLERRFRKEIGRSWRVFLAHEGAAFERITDAARAASVLAELERQQAAHLREQGADYFLDRPEVATFYRKLLADGIADGSVILTALTHDTEVVSALLGIVHGDTFVMVRISTGAKEWSNCSSGRLIIVRTMEMLQAQGFRHFDFSIGNYAYKRRLGSRLSRCTTSSPPRRPTACRCRCGTAPPPDPAQRHAAHACPAPDPPSRGR